MSDQQITTQPGLKKEVHLLQLVETLRALDEAWRSHSPAKEGPAAIAKNVSARCIQCQISLTEEELGLLIGPALPAREPTHGRLRRIQQGYCARRACDSYFYEVTLAATDRVDAESLWNEALESVNTLVYSGADESSSSFWRSALAHGRKQEVLVAGAIIATLSFLLWWNFRTPSWATRPSGYEVDPLSVAGAPSPSVPR